MEEVLHSEELEELAASEIQNADLEALTAGSNRGNDAKPQNRLSKTRYTHLICTQEFSCSLFDRFDYIRKDERFICEEDNIYLAKANIQEKIKERVSTRFTFYI